MCSPGRKRAIATVRAPPTQRDTAVALVWPFALGLNPQADRRGLFCRRHIDIGCGASELTCDPTTV